jgi:hypothetical protein
MDKSEIREIVELWTRFYGEPGRHFWIQLPTGPVERPFGNRHALFGIVISESQLEINFDSKNKLIIVEPAEVQLRRDRAGSIYLIFSGFSSYSFFLDGSADNLHDGIIKMSKLEEQIQLVGYSPDMSDPGSYPDINYRRLYSNAKLV